MPANILARALLAATIAFWAIGVGWGIIEIESDLDEYHEEVATACAVTRPPLTREATRTMVLTLRKEFSPCVAG